MTVFDSIPNLATPLVLDTGQYGGRYINAWVQNSTFDCIVNIEVSANNLDWIIVSQRVIPVGGGADFFVWQNAFRYVRINFVSKAGGTIYGRLAASR